MWCWLSYLTNVTTEGIASPATCEFVKRMRFITIGAVGLVALAVATWGGALVTRPQRGGEPSVSATVVRPIPTFMVQPFSDSCVRSFPGKVQANRRAELAFSVPGLLETLTVREGEKIKKGAVLAELDQRDYRNALDAAKAKYLDAKRAFDRTQSLRAKEVVCQAEFDKAEAACNIAWAELRIREKALEDTVLSAPFNGVVAKRHVENHEHVQAKQPILSFQDISLIEVVIQLPERLIAHGGAEVLRSIQVHFDADGDRWFDASIREFSLQSDTVTRTFDVVVGLNPPADLAVYPGMTATVRAEVTAFPGRSQQPQRVALIPAEAVWADTNGESNVWVVEPNGGPPHKTRVQVGVLRDGGVEILSGLQPGQYVAVAGLRTLREDIRVRPMIAGKKGLDG
ncbi:efflux RND transporter periplasmic adaptor subunit [Desulfomonile tiedjei]|uniref:RND family efflux transporter, MFP subunit n=1 Tax=Desulfomonile tiedjei (strain ATCC 49306 / DSM 6799 / DCB-1) TaxID=706587 RepID=I4C2M4_DESTA|nr:efflux RND transporter periplasmic adaptor subunit [Desulfomonile tiedjei]AFM23815.1 RND family efflux transporter, MFP subunit [Desulfomonile tiedjei DSM 6799]